MAIIIKADFNLTKEDIEKVEQEFLSLSFERDHMIYQEAELLKAEYMEKIGALEYKLYEFQIAYLRMKRKLAIIQQKINCQEKVNMENIEHMLDAEYEKYELELSRRLQEVTWSLQVAAGGITSDEKSKELRTLYKRLVKRLHPDMNPNESREEIELFHKAVQAYKNSDINELRMIDMLTEKISETEDTNQENKRARYNKLKKGCEEIRKEMEEIQKSFPFDKKDFLASPSAVAKRKAEIEAGIAEYKANYAELEAKVKGLTA